MAYNSEISRDHPTCFLFIIDQSGSMDEKTEGSGRSKAQFVSDVLNKTIYTLVTNCSKADGVRNYFDVGIIAYGGAGVGSGFGGAISGNILHGISKLSDHPLRVEDRVRKMGDGAGGIIDQKTKFPVCKVSSVARPGQLRRHTHACCFAQEPGGHGGLV